MLLWVVSSMYVIEACFWGFEFYIRDSVLILRHYPDGWDNLPARLHVESSGTLKFDFTSFGTRTQDSTPDSYWLTHKYPPKVPALWIGPIPPSPLKRVIDDSTPLWVVALPALFILLACARTLWRKHLTRARLIHGLCIHCGYDRRALPTLTCPECGRFYMRT